MLLRTIKTSGKKCESSGYFQWLMMLSVVSRQASSALAFHPSQYLLMRMPFNHLTQCQQLALMGSHSSQWRLMVILAVAHFESQAKGKDGIPHLIVAKALPVLAPHLTKLFSVSLSRGLFSSSWKKGHIIALKKVFTPSFPSEFRPIALLYFLSKVLEKLAHNQKVAYLKISKILDPF